MITLTRLHGQRFALNPDLIERVESTPDTIITLVDGTRHVVKESVDQVVERVRHFRATVLALSQHVHFAPAPQEERSTAESPVLRLVTDHGRTD